MAKTGFLSQNTRLNAAKDRNLRVVVLKAGHFVFKVGRLRIKSWTLRIKSWTAECKIYI